MNNSKVITGKQLKDMLLGAYHSFEKNFEAINDLNVFPVPDGDTGTNMSLTFSHSVSEFDKIENTIAKRLKVKARLLCFLYKLQ